MLIEGLHVAMIGQMIRSMLAPPSNHFLCEERVFKSRIMNHLVELLQTEGQRSLVPDQKTTMIQILEDISGIRITALNTQSSVAKDSIRQVCGKLDFWIDREEYNKYLTCGCCFGEYNCDQGVQCRNEHFFCSEAVCFETAVESQIHSIRTRDEGLVCPECKTEYEMKEIAPHLSTETWTEVHNALVDKKVEKQTEKLSKQCDDRLAKKADELLETYGQESELTKTKAKHEALTIRNTILNLSCPHCQTAYFAFDGCMALKCSSCAKHFCGYCHTGFVSGFGTHEHVRQCLMNETNNGSYYADAEQITSAQRRYRTRKLKSHLRTFKKNVQNAIIVELKKDLDDLSINPQALFEFGHIQPEIHEAL